MGTSLACSWSSCGGVAVCSAAREVTRRQSDTMLVLRADLPVPLASVFVKQPTGTASSREAQGFPGSRLFKLPTFIP